MLRQLVLLWLRQPCEGARIRREMADGFGRLLQRAQVIQLLGTRGQGDVRGERLSSHRTMWSLFNVFTGILSERQQTSAQLLAHLTIRLNDLFARACGLDAPLAAAPPDAEIL